MSELALRAAPCWLAGLALCGKNSCCSTRAHDTSAGECCGMIALILVLGGLVLKPPKDFHSLIVGTFTSSNVKRYSTMLCFVRGIVSGVPVGAARAQEDAHPAFRAFFRAVVMGWKLLVTLAALVYFP